MKKMGVVEIFLSIEGEGARTGVPVLFVRFAGCNLRCNYCDTIYSHTQSDATEFYTEAELVETIESYNCASVTFTGGEPLLHYGEFIDWFVENTDYEVNIETNGSIDITQFENLSNPNTIITMDYKCPSSGEESKMSMNNINHLESKDVLKFVVGSTEDLNRAVELATKYDIKAQIYISPVFGDMDLQRLAKFVVDHRNLGFRMGLQIHKFIWSPSQRGV